LDKRKTEKEGIPLFSTQSTIYNKTHTNVTNCSAYIKYVLDKITVYPKDDITTGMWYTPETPFH
jgi:hypothetical protein